MRMASGSAGAADPGTRFNARLSVGMRALLQAFFQEVEAFVEQIGQRAAVNLQVVSLHGDAIEHFGQDAPPRAQIELRRPPATKDAAPLLGLHDPFMLKLAIRL